MTTEAQSVYQMGITAGGERTLEMHPYLINPITGEPVSMEKFMQKPLRKRDHRGFQRTEDFIAYVNRFKKENSSIYVDGLAVIAELDHCADVTAPVWGDSSAKIAFAMTTGMKRWLDNSGKELGQTQFADLLEERAVDIVNPDSATMIEIAQALHVAKNSAVSSVIRQGVNHHITFSDEQKVRGGNDADIPSLFEIRLRPFLGSKAVIELGARLRVTIRSDKPAFVYELKDYQERILETLHEQVAEISEKIGLPAYI